MKKNDKRNILFISSNLLVPEYKYKPLLASCQITEGGDTFFVFPTKV
jgi:hypothetical protein